VLHPTQMLHPPGIDPKSPESVLHFFPKGVGVEQVQHLATLDRVSFFQELARMFTESLGQRNEP